MKFHHRARTAVLLTLVLLGTLPGVLGAACGPVCPFGSGMSAGHVCCRPSVAPTVKAQSCCETVRTAAPIAAPAAVAPLAPSDFSLALAAPLSLPVSPVSERPVPALPPSPPPCHEGIGLYTLHSVFLI